MSKVKVQLRANTIGANAGDVIEVDSAEIAEDLIRNGHAVGISKAAKDLEPDILGSAEAPKGK